MQKLLKKWAVLCVNNSYSVLVLCVLFSLASFIVAWTLWFPYSSSVSQLPKNFDERLAWEETSRQIQFNSEIMLRVSMTESERFFNLPEDHFSSEQTQIAEQRLDAAVALLKQKLFGNKKFCDVISSRDLQVPPSRELYELPEDDLQKLSAELLDARRVFNDGWAWLESANYADWLAARLRSIQTEMSKITLPQETGQAIPAFENATQQSNTRAILAENRRLLESAARFAGGLRQSLSQPFPNPSRELVTPWQLDPDVLFAKTDTLSNNRVPSNVQPSGETAAVIIWAKLAEPQLTGLLDRRVIGKPKKMDRKLIGKLNASMKELFQMVEDAGEQCADITIEPFGVPVDVYHGQTSPFPLRKTGTAVLFAALTLLFVAGFGHARLFFVVLVSVVCSFGVYLGFCATWFEMVTPTMLFIGIAIPLFGVCTGVLQAATFLHVRRKGLSVSEAIVEMMQISGKSILRGGLMTVAVFMAAVFYLWFYPVEPTTATLSFRSSLVGVTLTLFLLVQSVLACLIGQLAIFPTLVKITQLNRRILSSPWQKLIEARDDLAPRPTPPTLPLTVPVLLTFVLLAGFLYCFSRPHAATDREEKRFVTLSEKQAAAMPILVSGQRLMPSEFDDLPGLFACDASRLVVGNDAARRAMIDHMSHLAGQTSVQQKIPLPNQQTLHRALAELHGLLGNHFSELQKLQKITAFDQRAIAGRIAPSSDSLQDDLRLCQNARESIVEACRWLVQLPEKDFYERVDAWQLAVASDLVVQQRNLQNRLRRDNRPETEIPPAIAKRFLDADKKPLVWVFPTADWQTIVSRERSQPVIDLFLARENDQKTQPGHTGSIVTHNAGNIATRNVAKHGGFSLLVLEGRQLMTMQLPVVGAVALVALLLLIVTVHRSVQTGATTVMTIVAGVSLYGLIITALGIPFGKITLFPLVFIPMMYPVFLDLFRPPGMSHDRPVAGRNAPSIAGRNAPLKTDIGGTLVCLGAGIVVAGHLMFYADPALMTLGRTMTIGWVSFLLPLMLHLVGVALGESSGALRIASGESQEHTPPATHHTAFPTPQPSSLATRDQLDFYRERIEAAGVFGQQHETRDEEREARGEEFREQSSESRVIDSPHSELCVLNSELNSTLQTPNSTTFPTPPTTPSQVVEQAQFPPVWSVGTGYGAHCSLHRRITQRIVVELGYETFSDRERVVSLASHGAQIARKAGKITVTAKLPQEIRDEFPVGDTEPPTILPMRQHDETADPPPTPSRRRFG